MDIETFIAKWQGLPGGAERANFPPFISEFCRALGLPEPEPAVANTLTDYRFEAPVRPDAAFSDKSTGRIDLYKRRSFVLEAKQSHLKDGAKPVPVAAASLPAPVITKDLLGFDIVTPAAPKPKPAARRYDRLMEDALAQAKGYALALPADHGWPPFLIVCDVGRAFEIYFDWAGNGKGYGFFPDQKSYRIELDQLRLPQVQERLRAIWLNPGSIDPRRLSAEVTGKVARRLASVSKYLEETHRDEALPDWQQSLGIEETSLFLMRMLFCMFAEDVGLLPPGKFQEFLDRAKNGSDTFWQRGLADLWDRMGNPALDDRWWSFGDSIVRYFNGNLFSSPRIYSLPPEQKGELLAAARAEWRNVEPAIFGTLLEQALTSTQRAQLGAHYTPRPYVERLVQATIMDVLVPEWQAVREPADGAGPRLPDVLAFHHRLTTVTVLDPACGTGNFLYVAMEQLLRLESDVLVLIEQLGGTAKPGIGPNQFLGLELNPRAAVIAELVLWIGWLRFRLANDPDSITEPVLPPLSNINFGRHGGYDALLAGRDTEKANLAVPTPANWPEADFIVGNPPFIGGKDLRSKLGSDYAGALWKADPHVPKSADLVMQWWDRAAARLVAPGTQLRRFGFVTTNSITQSFSRRVIEARLSPPLPPAGEARDGAAGPGEGVPSQPLSETPSPAALARESPHPQAGEGQLCLVMAIPDHPWTRASKDAAAVRIAMTVAQAGAHDGTLIEITHESGLDTDEPVLTERRTQGRIHADLSIGTNATTATVLKANAGICHDGVKLHGKGFRIMPDQAELLGLGRRPGLEAFIRPYRNGRDLTQKPRGFLVIDLFGLSEASVRQRFPEVYQHLMTTVQVGRAAVVAKSATSDAIAYLETWWIFGKPRPDLRAALAGLPRYIATVDTAAHRVFQFLAPNIICDDKAVLIASEDAFHLGVLSSDMHVQWSLRLGGWLGLGNDSVYVKSRVFDPFPFPDPTPAQRAAIATLADELDLTRRLALDENPGLTMTGLYNLVAKLRSGAELSGEDEAAATRARARIVAKLHADLDVAVAAAYGWPADLPPAEIVTRLVALNRERAAEEAAGTVRWLRPDYQAPKA